MNNFKKLQSMSIDQLVDFLDTNGHHNAVWWKWFEEKYCNKCELEKYHSDYFQQEGKCAYCEIHDNCRFFPDMKDVPDNKETIKLWLEAEVKSDDN